MTKQIVRPHKVLENKDTQIPAMSLTDGPHAGIIFSYGKVSFNEDNLNDKLTMAFEYEIHQDIDSDYDVKEFEQELGDFLTELVVYGLANESVIYSGGTEVEDRTADH